jgi:hypothetical protein
VNSPTTKSPSQATPREKPGLDHKIVPWKKTEEHGFALAGSFRTIRAIKGTCGFLGCGKLETVAPATSLLNLLLLSCLRPPDHDAELSLPRAHRNHPVKPRRPEPLESGGRKQMQVRNWGNNP